MVMNIQRYIMIILAMKILSCLLLQDNMFVTTLLETEVDRNTISKANITYQTNYNND